MTTFYLICAAVGGTVFLLQLVLSLISAGGHDGAGGASGGAMNGAGQGVGHGVGHGYDAQVGGAIDHDGAFWGVFSLKAMVAGVTALGLGGLLAITLGANPLLSLPIALACAFGAMMLVAMLLRSLVKLSDDGTARLQNAGGKHGIVYISIPGEKAGIGKVHLELQGRTVEVDANTYGPSLDTGTRVVVTGIIGPNMVEVLAVPEMSRMHP